MVSVVLLVEVGCGACWLVVCYRLVGGRVCLVCYRLLMFVFGLGSFVVGVVLLLWLIVFAVWFLGVWICCLVVLLLVVWLVRLLGV